MGSAPGFCLYSPQLPGQIQPRQRSRLWL
ncbi:hypothetical protein BN1708_018330 [Verticillium longisporum]|uniref:Uncharacterized protein n=1 Tax=Verticillium longisporum TaxID=100787 RepID=A0A0G4M196_VERLO|nr:hypothetical protein BN1708_018330 [Verticillium longisporum]